MSVHNPVFVYLCVSVSVSPTRLGILTDDVIQLCENTIDRNVALQDLDEDLKNSHFELLQRFYKLFDSIFVYANDLNKYDPLSYIACTCMRLSVSVLSSRMFLARASVASRGCRFLEDLDEGVYIYQTLDSLLANHNGKQLLVEVVPCLRACMHATLSRLLT